MKNSMHTGTVLLVDDKSEHIHLLSEILSQHGYTVAAVKTGNEVLASIKSA
ncbi:MAG: hypothetical protein KJ578_13695 [Bacteroidetes bacterium]|nr:hypothetical protein [Bacteroidota bacterium]MBU2558825.1 hypothetical protein [Bacteroidota bacterium]